MANRQKSERTVERVQIEASLGFRIPKAAERSRQPDASTCPINSLTCCSCSSFHNRGWEHRRQQPRLPDLRSKGHGRCRVAQRDRRSEPHRSRPDEGAPKGFGYPTMDQVWSKLRLILCDGGWLLTPPIDRLQARSTAGRYHSGTEVHIPRPEALEMQRNRDSRPQDGPNHHCPDLRRAPYQGRPRDSSA
jgi:hypothetical protein